MGRDAKYFAHLLRAWPSFAAPLNNPEYAPEFFYFDTPVKSVLTVKHNEEIEIDT